MLNSTGFIMLNLAHEHFPMECVPFALDAVNLTRYHMVTFVNDPSIACRIAITLRIQFTGLDLNFK